MADLSKNVDIVAPIGENSDDGRKSNLKFFGYKDGEYSSDELPHRMAHIVGSHDGSGNDTKGKISILTNDDASVRGTVTHYSGYAITHGDGDITLSGSYQGNTQINDFTLYVQNNLGGYHSGVEHDSAGQYSVSAIGWSGRTDEKTYTVYDFDTTTFFTVDIYEGIKATWTNSTFGVGVRYQISYTLKPIKLYSKGDFTSAGKIVSEGSAYVPKIVASDGSTVLNTYS